MIDAGRRARLRSNWGMASAEESATCCPVVDESLSERDEDPSARRQAMTSEKKAGERSRRSKLLRTAGAIATGVLWWCVIVTLNPSGLGPGVTVGHLVQAGIILCMVLLGIRRAWKR